jgi:hypothetical protein
LKILSVESFRCHFLDTKSFEIAVESVEEIVENGRIGESAGKARRRVGKIIKSGKIGENVEKSEKIVENEEMGEFVARINFFFNFIIFAFAFRNILISLSYTAFSLDV